MTSGKTWEVYIIETESGTLYTGITTQLDRRFNEHGKSPQGARYFHFSKPSRVLFREHHENRSSASKREYQIKKMTKAQKLDLISNRVKQNPIPGSSAHEGESKSH